MTREEIQRDLIRFICRNFLVDENEIDLDESLVDQGIIDSFGLVEIATYIRLEYSVSTEKTDMNRDNFGSVVKMSHFVEGKTHDHRTLH